MAGLHLAREYYGIDPKLPIGTVGNPHFNGPIYQNGIPVIQAKEAQ